jgi:Rad3-related DNA helicase
MALMQAYGRGIRDMDDWCVMYIIDSSFKQLVDYNRGFFNEYFLEAVQKKK